jgi:hypothetical protein
MKQLSTVLLSIGLLVGSSAEAQLRPKFKDWFFYDVSHVQFLNAPSGLAQNWFSNSHSFSLMAESSLGDNFSIGYGLGYRSENYYNNLRIQTQQITGEEIYTLLPDSSFSSNRQNFNYLFIPVEFRFRAKENSKGQFFRLYLGANLGLRLASYAEFETEVLKQRYYGLEDLARFRADGYVRIGFDNLNLFVSYGFTELFSKGQAFYSQPSGQTEQSDLNPIRPLAIGVSISL